MSRDPSDVPDLRPHTWPPSTAAVTPAALALHNNFVAAVRALKRDLLRSIHYLRVIQDRRVHRALGYDTITAYAQAAVGFSASQTEGLLALGRNLERFPGTKRALAEGRLSWTKARLIVTKADPADERDWLEAARGLATGQLRQRLVGAARREAGERAPNRSSRAEGQPPCGRAAAEAPVFEAPASKTSTPAPPVRSDGMPPSAPPVAAPPAPEAPRRLVVSYSLTPAQYARWEVLTAAKTDRTKEDQLLAGLEALVDGEPGAGPRYLVTIAECPACGAASWPTSRGRFPVERPLLLAAHCDAIVQQEDGTRRATIPPRLRRRILARDGHRCQAPGCRHTRHLQIHHRLPRARGGATAPENLVTLCAACHRRLHRQEEELQAAGCDPCG